MSILKKDIEEFEDSKSDYGRGFFDGLKLAEAKLEKLKEELKKKFCTADDYGLNKCDFCIELNSIFNSEDVGTKEELSPLVQMTAKLRKWEYLESRKCLNCGKRFVAKIWVCQSGVLKGEWIISSTTCSTKCERKFREKLEEAEE